MGDFASSRQQCEHWGASSAARQEERPILWDVTETDSDRKTRFAYVLRRAREKRGLTPPQLAQRLGVSRGTVNKWEDPQAKDAPSILKLGPLCAALGLKAQVFAVLPPEPPSEVDDYLVSEAVERGRATGARRAARQREETTERDTPPQQRPRPDAASAG